MRGLKARKSLTASKGWVRAPLWREIVRSIPIACADIIFENLKGEILYGRREIEPYKGVRALPGGRLLYRESLTHVAGRIADEYGLMFGRLFLVGVFPVSFPRRSDVSVALAAVPARGNARVDGFEFSKFIWLKRAPRGIGLNYGKMISEWLSKRESREYLRLSVIPRTAPRKTLRS